MFVLVRATEDIYNLLAWSPAVALLVEVLFDKPEAAGSNPGKVTGFLKFT
jgi:hypothetical protein